MLALDFNWLPVALIVGAGGFLLALLRLSLWHADRRARSHTRSLLERDGAQFTGA